MMEIVKRKWKLIIYHVLLAECHNFVHDFSNQLPPPWQFSPCPSHLQILFGPRTIVEAFRFSMIS